MSSTRGRSRGRGRSKLQRPLRRPGETREVTDEDEKLPVQRSEQTSNVAFESAPTQLVRGAENQFENANQSEIQKKTMDSVLLKAVNNPVFTPKTFQVTQASSSLASAVNAPVFVPGQAFMRSHGTSDDRLGQLEHFVNNKLMQLMEDPGLLDEISMAMASYLSAFIRVENDMVKLSDLLFEKCVSQQNFQYAGSRLANDLDKKLKPTMLQCSLSFREVFLSRCRKENSHFQNTVAADPERACNVAMFLGELLMNYKTTEGETINRFIPVVSNIIRQLLGSPNRELLICAGKLLKLTGSSLDQNDSLFDTVQQLANTSYLDKTAQILFTRVCELRRTSWGQHEAFASPPNAPAHASQQVYSMYFPNLNGMLEEQASDLPVFAEEEWNEFATGSDASQDEMSTSDGNHLSEDFYTTLFLEQYGYYPPVESWSQEDDYDEDFERFVREQQR